MSAFDLLAQSLSGTQPVQQIANQAQPTNTAALIQFASVLTAGTFLLAAQFLVHRFTRRRAREDRLLNLFAELVALATDDLSRSKWQESMLFWRPRDHQAAELAKLINPDVPEWNKLWQKYENDRDDNRRQLLRVQCQIRLIEHEKNILNAVELIASSQPFFALPWRPIEGDTLDVFKKQIAESEKNLGNFMDLIIRQRSR